MEIIWWNDNKKRWLFVKWKHEHHAQLTNFASVRNSMVPNLNLLSSLTTLAVKKQAQFNEKNIYKKTNFDCKKNYYATNLQWAWSTKKSSNWISFFIPRSVFSNAKINLAFLDSHWRYSNKEDWKKEDNFCQFTNFSLSLFKPTLLWVYQDFLWLW